MGKIHKVEDSPQDADVKDAFKEAKLPLREFSFEIYHFPTRKLRLLKS
jgi:hypothetical protein